MSQSSSCDDSSSGGGSGGNHKDHTLQLHQHHFKWILLTNHVEPVKGFLDRYLRRKLIEGHLRSKPYDSNDLEQNLGFSNLGHGNLGNGNMGTNNLGHVNLGHGNGGQINLGQEVNQVIEWLTMVWQHINRVLGLHCEVTIGACYWNNKI